MFMTTHLDLSATLPDDADQALLIGRLWQPGVGPTVVACHQGGLFDLTRVAPTTSQWLELEEPAAALRRALATAPRIAELSGVPADSVTALLRDARGGSSEALNRLLEQCGARLVEVDVPDFEHLTELSRIIVYAEASSLHGVWLRDRRKEYSPQVSVRAATGIAVPAPAYLEALLLRPIVLRRFVESIFAECDVLHTPTLALPVPTVAATDVGSGQVMWDVIAQLVHCTAPINYLGVPALAVPAGFTSNGLPASFQLVGRPFAEATLLRAAHAYEQQTDWHERVPQL